MLMKKKTSDNDWSKSQLNTFWHVILWNISEIKWRKNSKTFINRYFMLFSIYLLFYFSIHSLNSNAKTNALNLLEGDIECPWTLQLLWLFFSVVGNLIAFIVWCWNHLMGCRLASDKNKTIISVQCLLSIRICCDEKKK